MIARDVKLFMASIQRFGALSFVFKLDQQRYSFSERCLLCRSRSATLSVMSMTILSIGLLILNGTKAYAQESDGKIITRSALGAWHLRYNESTPGLNCGIRFISGKRNVDSFAIFGPTSTAKHSTLLFSGSQIPVTHAAQETDLILRMKGLPESNLKGVILPKQANSSTSNLMVAAGDIRTLLQSMRDSEKDLGIWMPESVIPKLLIELNYDGLDKARTAMLDCVAGRKIGGQTMDAALAEIRPVGKSSISGRAYFKGGLLASKQYPPKGSTAVSLIWLTDEFNTWFAEVKANKKLPDQIPERIAKHFISTKILDDEGKFSFPRLPAGEYTLLANFNYDKEVNVPEVVGQTHTFNAAGVHLGTQDKIVNWSYIIKQPTTFQKQVTIKNDGDNVEITLDKSQTICFFVCF